MTRKPKRIALVLAASALAATGCSDEDLCKNTVCGQNAFCDTASGDCVCDSGYTSNDPARGCAEPTTCEVDSCSNHGSCSVNDGAIVCSCDQGYAAPTCANCATDYTQESGACIDSKQVGCTDAAPPNATSTPAQVTIIYTTAGGWTTPAACAWTCDQNYQQSGDACVLDSCPANYCNGHGICAMESGNPTCSCREGYAAPTCADCATDHTQEGGSCISSKQIGCTDAAPANATSTPAQVTIIYTTAGGWTTPAACAWTCDQDYQQSGDACVPDSCPANYCNGHGTCAMESGNPTCSCQEGYAAPTCADCATDHAQEGGACISSKQVGCTDAAPANATSTPAQVTIIYTTAGGWTTPAACAWTCDQDYQQSGDACVPDSCPVNYCNGHGTCAMASGIPTCTCDEGYATPTCSSCATDYTHEGGACISSKQVACTDAAPTNGTSTPAQVTITYTTAGGWTSPEACAWTCNQGYQQSGNACVLDSCPANYCNGHGTCAMPSGNPTCTCHDGYATPTCSSCATDYTHEGGACISSKQVACTDAAPANATSTPGQVTITYTTAGGWTTPAACAWTCDRDHELVGGTCVSSGEGEGEGEGEECSVEQSYGTVVPTWSYGESRDGHIVADFDINDDRDTVRIELFAGYGAFAGGPVRTGVYTISGDDLDYDTCGLCVSLYGDEYSANHYITGGTVTISSVSGRLAGTLSNATFEEVTIDDATLEPTPVPNGCRSAITSMAFDTVLE